MRSHATESAQLYEALGLRAVAVYREISRYPRPEDPSARRIWEAASEFVACGRGVPAPAAERGMAGAAFEALDKLLADWPRLFSGEITGEIAYTDVPDLWHRLMCEPPLGTYAVLAADLVNSQLRPGTRLVELGAGVGNTSRLLKIPPDVEYFRTDKSSFMLRRAGLPGSPLRYDFDVPSPLKEADVVFAVNALHCAGNHRRTLDYVREMLRPGGALILGEGERRPARNGPWALDALFCQFSGWWDRGGFRARADWLADLAATGFREIGYQPLLAGEYDLGGLIWARA